MFLESEPCLGFTVGSSGAAPKSMLDLFLSTAPGLGPGVAGGGSDSLKRLFLRGVSVFPLLAPIIIVLPFAKYTSKPFGSAWPGFEAPVITLKVEALLLYAGLSCSPRGMSLALRRSNFICSALRPSGCPGFDVPKGVSEFRRAGWPFPATEEAAEMPSPEIGFAAVTMPDCFRGGSAVLGLSQGATTVALPEETGVKVAVSPPKPGIPEERRGPL